MSEELKRRTFKLSSAATSNLQLLANGYGCTQDQIVNSILESRTILSGLEERILDKAIVASRRIKAERLAARRERAALTDEQVKSAKKSSEVSDYPAAVYE